ncbi:conserved hypothetical protein [Ricinus communis]|uniref:Uncharacterized protein n=1 Tax=Ricinus communis TaxID=3988 RepID=B9SSY1_RICCO|nr:conserved hypothetical protein [Ricinus communis]
MSLAAIREGAKKNNIVGTSTRSLSALTPKQKTGSLSALTSKKKRGREEKVVQEPKSLRPHVKIFGSIFQQGEEEENVNTKKEIKEFKENDMIQIWLFRVEGVLWLTLCKIKEAPNDNNANDVHKENGDGASTSHNVAVD